MQFNFKEDEIYWSEPTRTIVLGLVLVVVSLPVIVGMCYIIGIRCGQAFGKSKIDVLSMSSNENLILFKFLN